MCSCRGTAGFVPCRVWRAGPKIFVCQAEEKNKVRSGIGGTRAARRRAAIPRRRGVRARMGALESVRGPAGDGLGSETCDGNLGSGLSAAGHHEDALSVKEAVLSTGAATWRTRRQLARRAEHWLAPRIRAWTT